ncbi:MAG: excinuclease ABC subunit A, partial [Paramuribaculum sp.]|nr:excinuclease ABC subunit A [Paramuribaculum sp.]
MSNVTKIKDTTPKSVDRNIHISNARVNNLKGISADIERGSLTVITGVSGSGKSSLAFDTLYAEGQRRYVESLSAYARQFMGKMHKPECDLIRGLPPAIAIEQKVNTRNPRSTVGTTTEIYDYLRLLFGRIGRTYSPVSGKEVRCDTVDEIVKTAQQYHDGTRLAVAAPIRLHDGRKLTEQLALYLSAGYSRLIDADGTLTEIEEMMINPDADTMTQLPMLLIDRLAVERDGDEASRLADSVETALFEGNGEAVLLVYADRGSAPERLDFSTRFEADGMTFTPPSDQMFNFNSPYGACPVCEGFGRAIGIDEALVVPDKSKTVYEGAVACWRGPKMDEWRQRLVTLAPAIGFPIHRPYLKLTDEERHILWHGRGAWTGIDGFFAMVEENLYK